MTWQAAFVHLKRLDADFPGLVGWLQRCHERLERQRDASEEPNLYTVLDVHCDCSAESLKHAYRRQSKRLHPDRAAAASASGGAAPASTSAFQSLQRAYEVLKDPDRRRAYDYGAAADWELACRARY